MPVLGTSLADAVRRAGPLTLAALVAPARRAEALRAAHVSNAVAVIRASDAGPRALVATRTDRVRAAEIPASIIVGRAPLAGTPIRIADLAGRARGRGAGDGGFPIRRDVVHVHVSRVAVIGAIHVDISDVCAGGRLVVLRRRILSLVVLRNASRILAEARSGPGRQDEPEDRRPAPPESHPIRLPVLACHEARNGIEARGLFTGEASRTRGRSFMMRFVDHSHRRLAPRENGLRARDEIPVARRLRPFGSEQR